MGRSRVLEIAIVALVLGGATTYQFLHKKAEGTNLVKGIVDPPLKKPSFEEVVEPEVKVIPDVPAPPTRAELVKRHREGLSAPTLGKYNPYISLLGEAPDWALLDAFQKTITKAEFERLLTTVYTIGDDWKDWIEIHDDHALVVQSAGELVNEPYKLFFAEDESLIGPRYWRAASQMGPAPDGKPLAGMVIAIDPGHLGGEQWAKLEERDFAIGTDTPVREGEITLKVAKILKPQLEALGAEVVLVRDSLEPVNPKRPGHYDYLARVELEGKSQIPSAPAVLAMKNRMFYRVDEIRERANIINNVIKPDVAICLHFNATSWGEPGARELADESHFHVLLHGAFTEDELALDDERFSMVHKILMKNHDEEAQVSESVVKTMTDVSKLAPYLYEPDSYRARNIKGNDYMWARNLLANRLYDCPVVYMEPYVMNGKLDYARIQMGDYEGELEVDGEKRLSIFREYAHGVTEGFKQYYTNARGVITPPAPVEPLAPEANE